ncbi:cupin domain-containing protein [Herbiconiux sp. CPCC 203407]|uniref:Cupin domain-containing protein n=1 Tax=Herbiconiux oxytropis TaxID=2970915 RepID=A0AA42BRW2_9MICO|nr:cupin domain-containing protein [Herbiconiux oxytropis]MCS5721548.1 cupin domain-containing protein [Herbiconiux oxytropis]MCS5724625.1 cupin domain-containing protein [Herbiconiux oxytropis]
MTLDSVRGTTGGPGSGDTDARPALSRCIDVSPDTFAAEYWGRRALLSPASGLHADFSDLFSASAVDELVRERGLRTPFIRMAHEGSVLPPASFTASGGFGAEVGDQVSSEKVLAEFAAGATIVLQGLHRVWPPLIDFTRRLVDDIGHPAQVNAYVTPASSRGFDPHYDVHDVFVLQIAGEKHWRIHAPVHPDPLRDQPWTDHKAAVAEAALGEPVIDAVLRPGDALYLPRGWIHSATALGGTSVHLTVGMSAYTRADVVRALVSTLGAHESLRESLPLGVDWADAEAVRPVVEQVVGEMVAALTGGGTRVSPAADSGAGAGADAQDALVSRTLARRFAEATRPEPVAPLATIDAIASLGAASVVRWRGSLAARVESLPGDDGASGKVRIITPSKSLTLPGETEAAVRRLHEGGPVPLAELPGLDDADAVVVVRRLLREGILVPA